MLKALLLLPTLLIAGLLPQSTSAPATATAPPAIPADAIATPNPVKATPASQAFVKKMYGYDCASCHGDNGNGKGDMAVSMKLSLKDLTRTDALAGRTDGEIFWILKNGYGQMPSEGGRLTDTQLWSMVLYVRSLAGTTP